MSTERLLVIGAALALSLPIGGATRAGDDLPLTVLKAKLVMKVPRGHRAPSHRVVLRVDVPRDESLGAFDPTTDDLRVTIGGVTVFDTATVGARDRLREHKPLLWRYRTKRAVLKLDRALGSLKVCVRGVDLTTVRGAGPQDVTVAVHLGGQIYREVVTLRERGARWRYRRGSNGPVDPSPGTPDPDPDPDPGPDPGSGPLAGGVLATFGVGGDAYRIWVTNSQTIADLYSLQAGTTTKTIPAGALLLGQGRGNHNAPWSWHIDPANVAMVEVTMEACDGRPSDVENGLSVFLKVGFYCPWSAKLTSLVDYR